MTDSISQIQKFQGIVERVTYYGEDTGWSIIKVAPLGRINELITVQLYEAKVFAGATLELEGEWIDHPKYGRQFKAHRAYETKPATTAALEKYLGSGLIFGVGPKTAKKIVSHFKHETLDIFEKNMHRLIEVPGIAEGKLQMIHTAWEEHREIRNVMMFLQSHGVSTLFAVKIYKTYGGNSIKIVESNPYQLARDIYGIGFFSADQMARNLGFTVDSPLRLSAAIKHVLASAREEGHCYLTRAQIFEQVEELLTLKVEERLLPLLQQLEKDNEIKVRKKGDEECYYSKSLYFDEINVTQKLLQLSKQTVEIDSERVAKWVERYSSQHEIILSDEQRAAIQEVVVHPVSILTGGPGCGKTTTTKVLVRLLLAMKKEILLAAPTGRAAQRMSEVIGLQAKTLHRLLVWNPQTANFKKNEKEPLEADFIIIDECSMIDISLAASLLKAVPLKAQILFIGDSDQLPSVGPGSFFGDMIRSYKIPTLRLTQIFRQAAQSFIIQYAHQINGGTIPKVSSPLCTPELWKGGEDCLFVDSEELTKEQISFIVRVRRHYQDQLKKQALEMSEEDIYALNQKAGEKELPFVIPKKFAHVQLDQLNQSQNEAEELLALMKKIHPWSSLHYGFTALEMVRRLYVETIPKNLGKGLEIQVLSPMVRGSLGTANLNIELQKTVNPPHDGKKELQMGERLFREGDRVIQKRNNYDLGVFNGDIGVIQEISLVEKSALVLFDLKSSSPREVIFKKENLTELDLAYAITIHKSQGSEFDVVIIPILTQHFKMLYRNLIYTGLTRAKKLAVFVGSRRALTMAIINQDSRTRQTALKSLLKGGHFANSRSHS